MGAGVQQEGKEETDCQSHPAKHIFIGNSLGTGDLEVLILNDTLVQGFSWKACAAPLQKTLTHYPPLRLATVEC